jgi:methylamine---glutamate N-methyltransferase subunit C
VQQVGTGAVQVIADPAYRQGDHDRDATAGYAALGTAPGRCHHCHTGMCPVGVTTQDPEPTQRLYPETGRAVDDHLPQGADDGAGRAGPGACGKSDVHNLEPVDLAALTVEAAAMAQVPLAGPNWIPGHAGR